VEYLEVVRYPDPDVGESAGLEVFGIDSKDLFLKLGSSYCLLPVQDDITFEAGRQVFVRDLIFVFLI
jgi:hypothetical protein